MPRSTNTKKILKRPRASELLATVKATNQRLRDELYFDIDRVRKDIWDTINEQLEDAKHSPLEITVVGATVYSKMYLIHPVGPNTIPEKLTDVIKLANELYESGYRLTGTTSKQNEDSDTQIRIYVTAMEETDDSAERHAANIAYLRNSIAGYKSADRDARRSDKLHRKFRKVQEDINSLYKNNRYAAGFQTRLAALEEERELIRDELY